jgi:hypothetical protein
MEAQSRVLWDFLRLSYQRGLMDDLMGLGDLMDPNMDFVDALETFEETVMAMDLKPLTVLWHEQLQPVIRSMTNPRAIDALRAILQTLRPFLATLAARRSEGSAVIQNVKALAALKPHLAVLLGELGPSAAPLVQKFLREDAGRLMGRGLNAMSGVVLKANAEQPELVGRVFGELMRTVDAQQLGSAMEIILGGFLDQRPKIVRWTLGTTLARIKKRFARS